ncbi:hypothetical protein GEMRC1_004286 [Eukaryota sp. GEM-RC1]
MIRLFQSNFYSSFVVSFTAIGTLGAIILFFVNDYSLSQCIFNSFSALTNTGLTAFDFARSSSLTKCILLLLIQIGSRPLWSLVPLFVRRRFLIRHFSELVIPQEVVHTVCRRNSSLGDLVDINPDEISLSLTQEEENQVHSSIPLYKYSTEYWATTRLSRVVIRYIVSSYVLCFSLLSLRFLFSSHARSIASEAGGWLWFSFFHTITAFNNVAFSLLGSSLYLFHSDPFILLPLGIVMFAGSAGYPIFLRQVIKILSRRSSFATVDKFLLSHGREVYTHLFSQIETNWLAFWSFILYLIQFVSFLVFDFSSLPGNFPTALLNGVFGSIAVKSSGLNTFDWSILAPQTVYVAILLMLTGQLPFIATLRSSAKEYDKKRVDEPSSLIGVVKRILKTQQDNAWMRDTFGFISLFSSLFLH